MPSKKSSTILQKNHKKIIKDVFENDSNYQVFLKIAKEKVKKAQLKAALSVNYEMLLFYWELGRMMLEQQEQVAWGEKWIDQFSMDLQESFPEQSGFSRSNLHYMRKFAEIYPDISIVQQVVGQLPWGQNILLFSILDEKERIWYAQKAIEEGWARKELFKAIRDQLYSSQGKLKHKVNNYPQRLPSLQSAQAVEMLKDPYKFHFLTLGKEAEEKDVEHGLVKHITKFLLELGQGFSFCGKQHAIKVGKKTYRIDLLFYHYKLHCFVVIEIKRGAFKPEQAGQLNFYLSAVDSCLKSVQDNPSIGILFCEKKDKVVAEYALRDLNKPIGISEYELSKALPTEIKDYLPTVEELEEELNEEINSLK